MCSQVDISSYHLWRYINSIIIIINAQIWRSSYPREWKRVEGLHTAAVLCTASASWLLRSKVSYIKEIEWVNPESTVNTMKVLSAPQSIERSSFVTGKSTWKFPPHSRTRKCGTFCRHSRLVSYYFLFHWSDGKYIDCMIYTHWQIIYFN